MKRTSNWDEQRALEERADRLANELLEKLELATPPVDPAAVAHSESPILKIHGEDFREAFDGQLECPPPHNRFLLFYNTRHAATYPGRVRFSLAHELGHYFTPEHREFLLRGGAPHRSRAEYQVVSQQMEREADAFAAGLLLPRKVFQRRLGEKELSISFLTKLTEEFQTSFVCTALRAAKLTPFPCAEEVRRHGEVREN